MIFSRLNRKWKVENKFLKKSRKHTQLYYFWWITLSSLEKFVEFIIRQAALWDQTTTVIYSFFFSIQFFYDRCVPTGHPNTWQKNTFFIFFHNRYHEGFYHKEVPIVTIFVRIIVNIINSNTNKIMKLNVVRHISPHVCFVLSNVPKKYACF